MDQIFKQNIKSQLEENRGQCFYDFLKEVFLTMPTKLWIKEKEKTFEFPYSKGRHK